MREEDRGTKNIKVTRNPYPPLYLIIVILLFYCSCTHMSSLPATSNTHCIEDVPFYPQEAYQCGPAALAGVLNYWGFAVTPQEIAEEIFSKSARGTLNIDMVLYAQKNGLRATSYKGTIEDIKEKIHDGYPMIVLVDLGFSFYQANHFIVIIGFSQDGVVVNSGKTNRRILSWKDFQKAWEKTHFWTLFITPA
jgi:ABC-type bacteriocin/lantibiotic exporter with double-glycine peptidase domain